MSKFKVGDMVRVLNNDCSLNKNKDKMVDKVCEIKYACDNEEKAKILLKAFDKLGKKWITGDNYLKLNAYRTFKSKTIYYNDNTYGDVNDCIGKIFEFNEVDLEK